MGQSYANLDNDGSDQEDNLLFGMETVDNSVFPLVPDSEFDGSNLATIPEQNSFGDPLGVLRDVVGISFMLEFLSILIDFFQKEGKKLID